jgi:hypothetical protein
MKAFINYFVHKREPFVKIILMNKKWLLIKITLPSYVHQFFDFSRNYPFEQKSRKVA